MLFEITSQQNRTPPRGPGSMVRTPPARNIAAASARRNVAANTLQNLGRGRAGVSPATQSASPSHKGNTVTGWPTQHHKRKHHHHANTPAVNTGRPSYNKNRQQVSFRSAPARRPAQAGRKYIFNTVQQDRYYDVNTAPAQRVQTPVYNTYVQPPVSYDSQNASAVAPAPASSYSPDIANTVKLPGCKCGCCGSSGNGCTTLSYFEVGSAQLTDNHLQQIDELANTILKNKTRFITITGHTDTQGTDENNIVLGNDRSVAVNRELRKTLHQRQPWSQTSIFWKTKTKGESQPVSDTDAGLNRRVVVCLR